MLGTCRCVGGEAAARTAWAVHDDGMRAATRAALLATCARLEHAAAAALRLEALQLCRVQHRQRLLPVAAQQQAQPARAHGLLRQPSLSVQRRCLARHTPQQHPPGELLDAHCRAAAAAAAAWKMCARAAQRLLLCFHTQPTLAAGVHVRCELLKALVHNPGPSRAQRNAGVSSVLCLLCALASPACSSLRDAGRARRVHAL